MTDDIPIHLAHALPGRCRLRLESAPEEETWTRLAYVLAGGQGVRELRASLRTGSLLILFDPEQTNLEMILALVRDPDWLEHPFPEAAESPPTDKDPWTDEDPSGQESLGQGLIKRLAFPGMVLRRFLPRKWRYFLSLKKAWPFLAQGSADLFRGRLTIDLLDAAAIAISLIRRDARSVTIITTLLAVSEFLMQWTRKHSRDQLVRDLLHLPGRVWLLQDGREVSCPTDRVRPGDKVVVRTGSRIPVDGVILEGEAMVNQASMTGEPLAVSKSPGITVFAGTVVEEGMLVISADQVGDTTRAVKILKILETSERVKAGLESRAEQWADRVVPLTLALSILTLLLTRNPNRAASVLLVDFSCAIKLSTPLTMLSAMREASTRGVLIKGGRYLEKLEQADTFVFDKTGTLTQAAPMATEVVGFNGHQPRNVLRIAACLEEHFPHPLARAVVEMAEREGLDHKEEHAEPEFILPHGITSLHKGRRVLIGSRHFLQEHGGISLDQAGETIGRAAAQGSSLLFTAISDDLVGIILLEDPVRPDASRFLDRLRQAGIRRIIMLTGDGEESAATVARKLGIDEYHAQLLPEDKARMVKALRRSGRVVAMVGDGINDTPALSEADIGISLRSGADLAHEVCDVLLTRNELEDIITACTIGRRAMGRLRRNYAAVLGINGALMLSGLFGIMPPPVSALLHNLVTVLTAANSLRPLGGNSTHGTPPSQTRHITGDL